MATAYDVMRQPALLLWCCFICCCWVCSAAVSAAQQLPSRVPPDSGGEKPVLGNAFANPAKYPGHEALQRLGHMHPQAKPARKPPIESDRRRKLLSGADSSTAPHGISQAQQAGHTYSARQKQKLLNALDNPSEVFPVQPGFQERAGMTKALHASNTWACPHPDASRLPWDVVDGGPARWAASHPVAHAPQLPMHRSCPCTAVAHAPTSVSCPCTDLS